MTASCYSIAEWQDIICWQRIQWQRIRGTCLIAKNQWKWIWSIQFVGIIFEDIDKEDKGFGGICVVRLGSIIGSGYSVTEYGVTHTIMGDMTATDPGGLG